MGRLTPKEALGKYSGGKKSWRSADLPDIAVDLYDSPLRNRKAKSRSTSRAKTRLAKSRTHKRRLARLSGQEKDTEYARLVKQAVQIPKWYLRPDLKSFDHIHPNKEGHRVIVETACSKLPAEWGCDCGYIKKATGKRRSRAKR